VLENIFILVASLELFKNKIVYKIDQKTKCVIAFFKAGGLFVSVPSHLLKNCYRKSAGTEFLSYTSNMQCAF
jgi:hypothetical protein